MSATGADESASLASITARRSVCTASPIWDRSSPHSDLDVFERDAQQPVIDIVAAQVRVAVGGEHFEDAFLQLENRDVERAAAEIVDRDDAFFALVESVGERGGGGLVDQAQNFQPGDAAGVARGLALGVVEVGGDGDHGS